MEIRTAACTMQQTNLQSAVCFVLLPNISPSWLLVACFLKNEAVGHPMNRRNLKNSVKESISLHTTVKDTLHFKCFVT